MGLITNISTVIHSFCHTSNSVMFENLAIDMKNVNMLNKEEAFNPFKKSNFIVCN